MTDLTPNDLSHLSDEEFIALCPQGYHAPGPEPLNPAAEAMLDGVEPVYGWRWMFPLASLQRNSISRGNTMTNTPDFRAELEKLVDLYEALGGDWSPHGYTDTWNDALAAARTALATPPRELPDHVNLMGFAFGREPWATWLQPGGCLESAHRELSDLILAALAHWGRPATPPPEPLTEPPPVTINALLQPAYKLAKEDAELTIDGVQLVDLQWWHPTMGCNSLQIVVDNTRAILEATPPPPTDEERLADFTKWLAREMPPNTIIGDPLWWAPRIWRAALERWGHR